MPHSRPPARRRDWLGSTTRLEGVGSAFRYHIPFQRIACFLSDLPRRHASINASSHRFPASIKTAGSVQSPAGSGFHSVSATRPSRGGTNCDTMRQSFIRRRPCQHGSLVAVRERYASQPLTRHALSPVSGYKCQGFGRQRQQPIWDHRGVRPTRPNAPLASFIVTSIFGSPRASRDHAVVSARSPRGAEHRRPHSIG
jgi:hypothetical protein